MFQIVQLRQSGIAAADTQIREADASAEWITLKDVLPSVASMPTARDLTERVIHKTKEKIGRKEVETFALSANVSDVDMRFGSMVWFMVKWAFAAIPALFIIGLILLIPLTLFLTAAGYQFPR